MAKTYEDEVAEQAAGAASRAEITEAAKARIAEIMANGGADLTPEEGTQKDLRGFIAPMQRFTKYLIQAGKVNKVKDQTTSTGERFVSRDGDIFVEFKDGIVVLDPDDPEDQLRIAWCEANPKICKDIHDPFTEAWAYMKELQEETSTSHARLPNGVNLEAILSGDKQGSRVNNDRVNRARTQAKK